MGRPITKKKRPTKHWVKITNKSYGKSLRNKRIYYIGDRPTQLKEDGSIKFGKNILEILAERYKKFQLIINQDKDEIIPGASTQIYVTVKTLNQMNSELFKETRNIKNQIILSKFSHIYSNSFSRDNSIKYVPGTLSKILDNSILPNLSKNDINTLNSFIPDFISSSNPSTYIGLKAKTQIKTLKELAKNLEDSINSRNSEAWWQEYIKKHILLIQQGYIQVCDKINVEVGRTKFPDFVLITHDGFLDILEIKKPDTSLIRQDSNRDNYFWDTEIAKALIQVENYIESILKKANDIKDFLMTNYDVNLQVVRPRGIILAGNTVNFSEEKKVLKKQKDDFRLLCQSQKNITIITYDELLNRLKNFIQVLESYSSKK